MFRIVGPCRGGYLSPTGSHDNEPWSHHGAFGDRVSLLLTMTELHGSGGGDDGGGGVGVGVRFGGGGLGWGWGACGDGGAGVAAGRHCRHHRVVAVVIEVVACSPYVVIFRRGRRL